MATLQEIMDAWSQRRKRMDVLGKVWSSFGLAGLLVVAPGCASVMGRAVGYDDDPIYVGTRIDIDVMTDQVPVSPKPRPIEGVIDFPFSLVADTLCFPVDCIWALTHGDSGDEDSEREPARRALPKQ